MSFYTNRDLIQQLKYNGVIQSPAVEQVMLQVDRAKYRGLYTDSPQTIGFSQTISAPHMHAMCLELLAPLIKPGSKVLDVGSGSGYLTACMAHLVGQDGRVTGVEYVPQLVDISLENIRGDCPDFLTQKRIIIFNGDGWKGHPEGGPYDAIHVGAAAEELPVALVEQLAPGGKLVIPIGHQNSDQYLYEYHKQFNGDVTKRVICGVRYVPLVKKQ